MTQLPVPVEVFDPTPVLKLDGYLKPEIPAIATRFNAYNDWKRRIQNHEGGYDAFSKGYEKYGFNVADDGTITYREWAPGVKEASLTGDFSESIADRRPSGLLVMPWCGTV